MQEKILIVSNYFPPETGAAPNRIATLAQGLQEKGWDVSVLCPLPNYPNGKVLPEYQGKIKHYSSKGGLHIFRTWIYPSISKNKVVRLISMLSFSFSMSLFLVFKKTPKKIIIQSPPLFVAFFAVLICRLKSKKIILNVSDLWPLAGKELGVMKEGFSYKLLERIEKFNYKNAHLILGQSEEICEHISHKVKTKSILYRNYPKFTIDKNLSSTTTDKIHIIYAGLLGVAQGIVELCEKISIPENIVFDIYGNGAEKLELIEFIKKNPKINILYHGELTRTELHQVLAEKADYAIIPLVNRIYGSVPSKIFEMANMGLPVIYMGGGEGELIVNEFELGKVVNPTDYNALNKLLSNISKTSIQTKETITTTAKENFSFDRQLILLDSAIKAVN